MFDTGNTGVFLCEIFTRWILLFLFLSLKIIMGVTVETITPGDG